MDESQLDLSNMYAEFLFLDPTRLRGENIEAVTVLTVSAVLAAHITSYLRVEGAMDRTAYVQARLTRLEHTKAGRRQLLKSAEGVYPMYYCSICGGRLLTRACEGCGRRYAGTEAYLANANQPLLPHRVADYIRAHTRHTFRKTPKR